MNLRERFLNMLGAGQGVPKQENAVFKSARDFLRYGNRDKLYPSWSDIKMSDSDMYRGYSYAVIQKRGNKVASLAKANLKTWANPEIVDEYQKKQLEVIHPYLTLIEDSSDFTEKQFWKNISIYLDLAGRYYLGVIRNEIRPLNPKLPIITTDPVKFVMLNPYEIRRVVDKDKNVAGYIERKKDGRYREWPKHQIIEMRELDPFDPENGQWAMTDAAKNAVYTINQSGDYTRQSLNGNIDAPGIITTDVLLSDEDFANFRARITQHTKGEPLFGNGTGAINWDSMQIDLDKAALLDINEINRTELFAVSGTSKTSLGIEQSGTTRETARVQSEQFVSDTAQPRLEDIVDFLNLDYKKHYANEYQKTGYKIEVESSVAKDYETEQKATELKQSQFQLAMTLVQSGYTTESAYQFAEGKIDFEDLELEKGLDKPKSSDEGEAEGGEENSPDSPNNGPRSGSGGGDGSSSGSENNGLQIVDNDAQDNDVLTTDLNDITPHSELMENGGKGSGFFGHAGRKGEVGGSAPKGVKAGTVRHQKYASGESESQQVAEWEETNDPIYPDEIIVKSDEQIGHVISSDSWSKARVAYTIRDKRVLNPFRDLDPNDELDKKDIATYREYMKATFKIDDKELDRLLDNTKNTNSVEGEKCDSLEVLEVEKGCTCEHDHRIETFINEVAQDDEKVVNKAYKEFLKEVREIEKETVDACARKVNVNAFDESDIIGKRKKLSLIAKLKNALHKYWWAIFPLLASNSMEQRNKEFGQNETFVFTNDLQNGVDDNAERVSEGHMTTILGDILEASNKAYTSVLEDAAAELIVKVYDDSPTKWEQYFDHKPTKADALDSIRRTDILEKNRKIYERANTMAFEGYNRRDIIKAIRNEYEGMSKKRAELIARNETARAYGKSQFEADRQFLNGIGKIDQAYKVWKSRRPANEREKICPFCRHLIETSNANPIPFEKPFVEYGDSLEVIEDGKVKIFTANYEDIQGNSLHPNCYAKDTQVYTNEGWKRVDELTGKELFWSIDPETKKPEWVKAKARIEGYAETLLRFQNKNFDMAVTKDHNMYVESRHGGRREKRFYSPQFKEAQTLTSTDRFYGGVVWEGKEPKTMKIGNYEVPTELYCKFMGYYLSEGCANYYEYKKGYQGDIGQQKHHDRFWNDLQKLPFRIWNGETDFTFTDKSVVEYCMQFGKSFEKYIPEELKELSPRLLKIFIDAFVLGDGSKKYSTYSNAWDVMMFTSSIRLRDDLTEVIQKAGYRPTVRLMSSKGTAYKGTNYVSNYDVWKISLNNRLYTIKQNTKVEEIEYHDNVYCVELEKNHTLWVMYNGKCWWSGNCLCFYELVFKNAQGEFVKTLNGGKGSDKKLNER